MSQIEKMHNKIETIFNSSVDHIHADILHRFIDEQQQKIDELQKIINFISCDVIELPNEIETAEQLREWAKEAVYCSCMNKV